MRISRAIVRGAILVLLLATTTSTTLTPRLQAQSTPAIVVDAPSARPSDQLRAAAAAHEAAARYLAWLGPAPVPSLAITAAPWRGRPAGAAGHVAVRFPWWPAPESMDIESQVAYGVALEWVRSLAGAPETQPLARGLAWYLQSRIVEPLYDLAFHVPGHSAEGFRLFGGAVPRTFHALPAGRWTLGLGRGELAARLPPAAVRPADLDAPALRMAQTFGTLERYLGWPALQGALHALTARAASTKPTRQDAVETLSASAGQDLRWLFEAAFDSHLTFDYAVASMAVTAADRPCGFEPCFLSRVMVVRRGDGAFSGPSRPAAGPYESGDAMELRVEFGDGQLASARWDGRSASRTFEFLAGAPVAIARLDPDRILLLDRDYLDNFRAAAPNRPPPMGKWIFRWLIWLQDAMLAYTF